MIRATIRQRRGAIVLAGGEGTRLQVLTAALAGAAVPKQYCPLFEHDETMLERTIRRVALSVRPERTATVVVRGHRQFYARMAASGQTGELVVQPANRGTAPAVLYGLVRLAHQVQLDAVAIFPTDHYVDNDRRFMRHRRHGFCCGASRAACDHPAGDSADRGGSSVWLDRAWRSAPGLAAVTAEVPGAPFLRETRRRPRGAAVRARMSVEQLRAGGQSGDSAGAVLSGPAAHLSVIQRYLADFRHSVRKPSCRGGLQRYAIGEFLGSGLRELLRGAGSSTSQRLWLD